MRTLDIAAGTCVAILSIAILATMIVTYLALVEIVKRWFYRVSPM